ncbi:MAG: GHKL domain-containing protein [Lachnospiraceae bacterium]|nr:GHKL domain-containing protein [Lachnospiraceae bacterium]
MPPLYRIAEVVLFSILNFLPYLVIALYPFHKNLRHSMRLTVLLITIIIFIQIGIGLCVAFLLPSHKGLLTIASTTIYFIFYFGAVRVHPGKTLFTLLLISNIANFVVVSSKCLEGFLFPEQALQQNRWSYSALMFTIQLLVLIPLFLYIRKFYTDAVGRDNIHISWWYLWLIPATFYLIQYSYIYGNTTSGLEIALQPQYTVFLLLINLGEFLVYHIVVCLIREYDINMELELQNHLFALENLQYSSLKERIEETRKARHDIKHHIAVINGYLQAGKIDKLKDYLANYCNSLPDDGSIVFCRNYIVNLLLLHFAQQAKENRITFTVYVDIPEYLKIAENDLSVILGNLLENAIDACNAQTNGERKIIIHGKSEGKTILFTIDNTFEGELKQNSDGIFLSSKHEGTGIGIESVKYIVRRYNGIYRTEQKDGMFYSSVLLNSHE